MTQHIVINTSTTALLVGVFTILSGATLLVVVLRGMDKQPVGSAVILLIIFLVCLVGLVWVGYG